jgi:hypothetical protein
MRARLGIIVTLAVVVLLLIILNAASYVKVEQTAESEESPDRSTYNAGATGTRALYDFLRESGHEVARWTDSTSSLLSLSGPKPATMVVVGRTVVSYTNAEAKELLHWVEGGGRLVVVDRTPDERLLPKSESWTIRTHVLRYPFYETDPTNLEQMTAEVKTATAAQPTRLSRGVQTVLPSRFAGAIDFSPDRKDISESHASRSETESAEEEDPETYYERNSSPPSSPGGDALSSAPVVHIAGADGALLVDYPHGRGRIVLLSDPFIVANNGIGRADNLILALNVVTGTGGLVAFDEFHQGRASTHNALIQYFEGTPVLALCGQFALIALVVVWSRGRRFARALPLPQVDRRSSLEFVASMAELEQLAKAHDLALENIYGRVRRAMIRYAGLNNLSPRSEVAARVSGRSGLNRQELESLMRRCEEAINGANITGKQALHLAKHLREIESSLGLRGRVRDERQSAEKADL